MRINIGRNGIAGSLNDFADDGAIVHDPQPRENVNDHLNIEVEVTHEIAAPFTDVNISWEITQKSASEYTLNQWTLSLYANGTRIGNILPNDSFSEKIVGRRWYRIYGTLKPGRRGSSFDSTMNIELDTSSCEPSELSANLINQIALPEIEQMIDDTPNIGKRSEIVLTWDDGLVNVRLPLHLAIPNYFDADLTANVEIRINVLHSENNSQINITSNIAGININFHSLEDILSLGSSRAVSNAIEAFLPTVISCLSEKIVFELLKYLIPYIESTANEKRLYRVEIENGYVRFTFCDDS